MDMWTLDELVAKAAELLATADVEQGSGRVREVPDKRTLRYYTTLGLLDRPAEMRGRTGLFTVRHLMQLMAIKRLQAQGESLQRIQDRLFGVTAGELKRLAALPKDLALQSPPTTGSPRARSFWADAPEEREDTSDTVHAFTGLELEGGVTLTLSAARRLLETDDVEALKAAAAPLLKVLRARHLV
jgi:DNA-binding transcriptional MerR regulator